MKGKGVFFLQKSLDILADQSFKDFDVIISDHSTDNYIEKLCLEYENKLDIKYYKNNEGRGGSSANINNAIKKATGKLIKILFQDDFLFHKESLEEIAQNFDFKNDRWLLTACTCSKDGKNFFRNFLPKYNYFIHFGFNTISSPSVLTIKNDFPLFFDENLIWLMDCDYYKRCYDKFGPPKILNTISVVNRIGKHQVTNNQVKFLLKIRELWYITKKYLL